jgi:hypothetical protein
LKRRRSLVSRHQGVEELSRGEDCDAFILADGLKVFVTGHEIAHIPGYCRREDEIVFFILGKPWIVKIGRTTTASARRRARVCVT